MKTNDYCAIPQQLKDQVIERYPGARQACLKSGGDFPFLSRPDEINLHLQVLQEIPALLNYTIWGNWYNVSLMWQLHLRRVGVEGRQDMVPGIPKDDPGGSSSDQNDKRGGTDDAPEDETRESGGPTNASEPPLIPEGPDSSNFKNQILSNSYISNNLSGEYLVVPLVLQAILNVACEYAFLNLVNVYLSALYINLDV